MGATYKGKHAGTFGIMGSYSCFFSHHISTMEGGIVVTDDTELYHLMLSLRSHGWTRHLPTENKVTGTKSKDTFRESYKFVTMGYNLRPLEMSGAIGRVQLRKLPSLLKARELNAAKLHDILQDSTCLMTQRAIGSPSWFGFSLIIKPGAPLTRAQLMEQLDEMGFEYQPIVTGKHVET